MKKEQFMRQLKGQLLLKMPRAEAESVLEDYEEYFSSGGEEGLGEEKLCERFGTPREIAAQLGGRRSITLVPKSVFAMMVPVLFMVLFGYFYLRGGFATHGWGGVFLILNVAVLLCCCKDGAKETSRRRTTVLLSIEGILLAAALLAVLLCYNTVEMAEWMTGRGIPLMRLGPVLAGYIFGVAALLLVLWMWEIICLQKLPRFFCALFPLHFAELWLLWSMLSLLMTMSDPVYLKGIVLQYTLQSLIQLLPVLLLLLPARSKEVAHG